MKDITLRAIDMFESIDVLLCEDTRKTGILLKELKIANTPKLLSFYDEVERQKIPQIVEMLKEGLEVGLVTDAGTPLLSDPGWLLVRKCQELGLKYTALPGASATINALVLAGLPMGRFSYLGFLPKKDGERKKILEKYKEVEGSKVVYESPLRTEKLVKEVKEIYGDKVEIRIIREMTKKFEEIKNDWDGDIRGEVVVVFA
ncbi:MAG: Ribosomal RNA small subunit methyltransferase I [Candidatus Shapirobacteria bacterium GW2011_GWE1_38_10]|uniref:Ribosomal RNA small subunit methyltransferase I n=1 Tax=Candidatus Shapirobacteria bacterium GW2011_GWE1_38_10 TaxID=1618488 RepID=A0A0G0LCL0_9BACT|nr:MAG: Ribosomal RNA small subunit methyltransferase I [Candidatus Shapirobacteria bacterium GW2011_GWF2_37_20]KKQ50391.1 MAG: Ribosomal RNA small subunit methyltransferase I [Candidatus Shapirobacteria bacterium GW2011_GWE1_38_10]KKQ65215.1 MAG: Ribosomal RNA small subunit methyltransferase I [Candidatus Shapirobacteria bacterium GW2011_GWF1_38_23]